MLAHSTPPRERSSALNSSLRQLAAQLKSPWKRRCWTKAGTLCAVVRSVRILGGLVELPRCFGLAVLGEAADFCWSLSSGMEPTWDVSLCEETFGIVT